MGLFTAAFVFFITIFLIAKQWIQIPMALLLLIFSLVSGLIVANQDALRDCLKGTESERMHDVDLKVGHFQEQMLKNYDAIKADLEIQKHKLQALSDEIQAIKTEEKK